MVPLSRRLGRLNRWCVADGVVLALCSCYVVVVVVVVVVVLAHDYRCSWTSLVSDLPTGPDWSLGSPPSSLSGSPKLMGLCTSLLEESLGLCFRIDTGVSFRPFPLPSLSGVGIEESLDVYLAPEGESSDTDRGKIVGPQCGP